MLTVKDIAIDLARKCGAQDLTGLDEDGLLEEIRQAINSAAQTIRLHGPIDLRQEQRGYMVFAPRAVTINVVNGSKTIGPALAATMVGCMIQIGGESNYNVVKSVTELVNPILGATANGVAATVYGDAITLETDVLGVALDPELVDFGHLIGIPNPRLQDIDRRRGTYGDVAYTRFIPEIDQPHGYFVESMNVPTTGYVTRRLRISPLPDRAYLIRCWVELAPPVIALGDLSATDKYVPVPGGMHEKFLRPLAREAMMTSTFWKDTGSDSRQKILEEAREARDDLDEIRPQRQSNIRCSTPEGM